MSHDQLAEVEASRALEATRRFEDLFFYHVPFDELNNETRTECVLARLVASGGRVAVIGSSGCGKSSVISSVLGPLSDGTPEHVVPLRIPVAAEPNGAITEPGALARHLVRYITRWASPERFTVAEREEFERGSAEIVRRAGGRTRRRYHVALPLWLANAGFAREVQTTGEDYEQRSSSTDAVECLKRIVALFSSHQLCPVLVLDDSDTWLSIPGLDRTEVANAFFMKGLRVLSKEVDAGLVVAVHDHYLELPGYREGSRVFSGSVRVPRLTDPERGIGRILDDRLVAANVGAPLGQIIAPDAVARLAVQYEAGAEIRDVLRATQRALQNALSGGFDILTRELIEQAISELAPSRTQKL